MSSTAETPAHLRPIAPLAPIEERPEAIVTKVYPAARNNLADPIVADEETWKGHTRYLKDRLEPDASTPQTSSQPVTVEVPVVEWRSRREWRPAFTANQRRWIAAGAIGATFLAFAVDNANSLLADGREAWARAKHTVSQLWKSNQSQTVIEKRQLQVDGGTVNVNVNYAEMPVGTYEANPEQANEVLDTILEKMDMTSGEPLIIRGDASDDWGSKASLTRPDKGNNDLARKRATAFKEALEQAAKERGIELPPILIGGKEYVLDQGDRDGELRLLNDVIRQHDLSYDDAKRLYEEDASQLPRPVRELFNNLFGVHRGVIVRYPVKTTVTQERSVVISSQTAGETPPHDEKHPYDPNLWPLMFLLAAAIPRYEKKGGWAIGTTKETVMPGHIPSKVWLKLHPYAYGYDNRLLEGAFAYSSKYHVLMNEERIPGVLRYDYQDGQNKERALRILFVDHEPAPHVRERLEKALRNMANVHDKLGVNIAERLHTITVFPTENAGTEHGDPKRIGLGIDKQYESAVDGVATPLIGLVEMQISPNPTDAELDTFEGALYTLGHEAAHMANLRPGVPVTVEQIGRPEDRTLVANTPWAGTMRHEHETHLPLRALGRRQFEIEFTAVDRDGNQVTMRQVVGENDPRLAIATSAQLVGNRRPTRYSDADREEMAGDVGGQALTGIAIPWREAGVQVPKVPNSNFAPGYRAPKQLENIFAGTVSAVVGPDGKLTWKYEVQDGKIGYGPILDDPDLGTIARAARHLPMPKDNEFYNFVADQVS